MSHYSQIIRVQDMWVEILIGASEFAFPTHIFDFLGKGPKAMQTSCTPCQSTPTYSREPQASEGRPARWRRGREKRELGLQRRRRVEEAPFKVTPRGASEPGKERTRTVEDCARPCALRLPCRDDFYALPRASTDPSSQPGSQTGMGSNANSTTSWLCGLGLLSQPL